MINLKAFRKSIVLASILFLTPFTSFAIGDKTGNGGDTCEDRIQLIRDDLSIWIRNGGSRGLRFTPGAKLESYNAKMIESISKAQISCTDQTLEIAGAEKVCVNSIDAGGVMRLICNAKRFADISQADQYTLIHHEYAGLSGLENNVSAESNYKISNQISAYLEDQIIKHLVVKPSGRTAESCIRQAEIDYSSSRNTKIPLKCDSSGFQVTLKNFTKCSCTLTPSGGQNTKGPSCPKSGQYYLTFCIEPLG